MYIPNVADLRRSIMDEIHKFHITVTKILENHCDNKATIFLAKNEEIHCWVYFQMHEMLGNEGWALTTSMFIPSFANSRMEMGSGNYGFYY